jgi:cell wall-associated NlpC family hydrolase
MYQPQPGDIGLTQITGDVGRLIRLGQWLNGDGFADWEHCFVSIGNGQIVEAEPGGARIAELTEYDGRNVVWLRCPAEHRQAVADAARGLVGTPYSFLDYLALALGRFHIPVPGLRRLIGRHRICSALADAAAQAGDWTLFDDERDPGDVTPADIWQLIRVQDGLTHVA